jgi:hypothetical protein
VSILSQCDVRLAQNLRVLDCLWLMKLTPTFNGNIVCKYEWTKVSDSSNFPYVSEWEANWTINMFYALHLTNTQVYTDPSSVTHSWSLSDCSSLVNYSFIWNKSNTTGANSGTRTTYSSVDCSSSELLVRFQFIYPFESFYLLATSLSDKAFHDNKQLASKDRTFLSFHSVIQSLYTT